MGTCTYCHNVSSRMGEITVGEASWSCKGSSPSSQSKKSDGSLNQHAKFIKLKSLTKTENATSPNVTSLNAFLDQNPEIISTECYMRTNSLSKSLNETSTNLTAHKTSSTSITTNHLMKSTSQTTMTNPILNENQFEISAKSQTKFISNDVINLINENYLFGEYMNSRGIKTIVDEMVEYQIDPGVVIFKEEEIGSGMFIIKNGQIEIYDNNKSIKLFQNDYFGELSLIKNGLSKRKYSAKAVSQVNFYFIDCDLYNGCKSKRGNDEIRKQIFSKAKIFDFFDENEKDNLALLSREVNVIKGEDIANSENLYVLVEGSCIVEYESAKVIYNKKGDVIGFDTIFNKSLQVKSKTKSIQKITPLEKTKFLFISHKCLIEIFGVNYQKKIIFAIFNSAYKKNKLLTSLFGLNNADQIYDKFILKKYKLNSQVYFGGHQNQNSQNYMLLAPNEIENKKLCFILHGTIGFANNNDKDITINNGIIGEEYIDCPSVNMFPLISKDAITFALEIEWEKVKNELKTMNKIFYKKLKNLQNIEFLSSCGDIELIQIAENVIPFTFCQDELIISPKLNYEHFFMLIKGEVEHRTITTDICLYTYRKNSSFGEMFLLNPSSNAKSFLIVTSKLAKTYAIDKDYFFDLIQKEALNDYIKRKMCFENSNIKINDLFYLSYLGRGQFGNVCLVHNTIAAYAAKLVTRSAIEKRKTKIKYLLTEKNALNELSHPFILKYVKTLKAKGWCIFLTEHIPGTTLNDLVSTTKLKRNVECAKFYAGCMFLVLDYLTSMKYLHRDIKPSNIMIDQEGYIRLIDFGTAKKAESCPNFKQTVIGTPNFMAPEVINSKAYSFPCDYWSLGVTLYYIYYGEYPFGGECMDVLSVYKEILNKQITFVSENNDYELNNLISVLLNKNPNERLSAFKDVKAHFLFKNFPWDDILRKRIKAPYIPSKDKRNDEENLNNINTPFGIFLENEKQFDVPSSNRNNKSERNLSFFINNNIIPKTSDRNHLRVNQPKSQSNINLVKVHLNGSPGKSLFKNTNLNRRYSDKDWYEDF